MDTLVEKAHKDLIVVAFLYLLLLLFCSCFTLYFDNNCQGIVLTVSQTDDCINNFIISYGCVNGLYNKIQKNKI